jgi:transcriptional regulator with XRE-family HTH domain
MESNIISLKIKANRKLLGLTQEQFSKKIESSLGLVKMYETGVRKPSKKMKDKICEICNISLNELEGLNDKEQLKTDISSKISNIKIKEKDQETIKKNCIAYFYNIIDTKKEKNIKSNNELSNIIQIVTNTIEQFIRTNYLRTDKEQAKQDFLNLDKDKMNFIDVKSLNKMLFNDDKYIEFIKNNMDFISTVINELQFNIVSEKYVIPLVSTIFDKWEDNINNANDFIELPSSLKDNKYVALYVNDELSNFKYEVGNILIVEWKGQYKSKDDVIIIEKGKTKIRRFYNNSKIVTLKPLNINEDIETYSNSKITEKNIKIIGKIIGIKI